MWRRCVAYVSILRNAGGAECPLTSYIQRTSLAVYDLAIALAIRPLHELTCRIEAGLVHVCMVESGWKCASDGQEI